MEYICADDFLVSYYQNIVNLYYTNCFVNTYCSFTPSGAFYTIQGKNTYDENNNACDLLDISFPNMKYSITNGTNTGSLISNLTGNFTIPVQAGTHTLTAILENPTYFNISPTSTIVNFPATASPATQDFCITANGVHNDLEVILMPVGPARPGFDVLYKIVYKNKGNQTLSGAVNVTFEDDVLDFVSANPITTTQSLNNLFWNFTNLLPFETREIIFTLNLNSPLETPPVDSGYLLNFTTSISNIADETPLDNSASLEQIVTNSYDPNDKTCLEGTTITPSMVGNYVHYMIRFENNGTGNAQNIVVKDVIDTSKFDISTLVPLSGSHSFETRITNTNNVEFIFQNINLPFANETNDGYVTFKIKTKPTLVLGNSFSNTANIYFDYNAPIVTNEATTTVANVLSNQDFVFSNYLSISPNPAKDFLNLKMKQDIDISTISIYNVLGQVVQIIPNAKNTQTIDVSSLKTGNYIIKIVSDKGTSSSKFIKE